MPLYCAEYLADTTHLTGAESGAYLHLIMHYWLKGGLQDDEKQLARIARMSPKDWALSRDTIFAFFEPGWRHARIEKELKEAQDAYDRRSKAGRKGGNAKAMLGECYSNEEPPLKQSQPPSSNEERSSFHSDLTREQAKPKPPRKHPFPPNAFETWYAQFPEKVGRGAAESAFEKVRKGDDVAFEELLSGLAAYKRNKPHDRAWCNPSTWLNQKRWADQPASSVVVPRDDQGHLIPLGKARWPEASVRKAVDRWRRDGIWLPEIGPPPDHPGCEVPAHLLQASQAA